MAWRGRRCNRNGAPPYDGRPVGSVPVATIDDAAGAVDCAETAARVQRETPAHERVTVLLRAADLADQRAEDIAQTITAETGKADHRGPRRGGRSGELIRLAAFEGTQLYGRRCRWTPRRHGAGRLGFTLRQPCGVVVAITPVQLPGAAGAAQDRAGTGRRQRGRAQARPHDAADGAQAGRVLLEAGLPDGRAVGADRRRRRRWATRWSPTRGCARSASPARPPPASDRPVAGVKKLSLELGATCPVVVLPDADIELAAAAVARRRLRQRRPGVHLGPAGDRRPRVDGDFLDALVPQGGGHQRRRPGRRTPAWAR